MKAFAWLPLCCHMSNQRRKQFEEIGTQCSKLKQSMFHPSRWGKLP